MEEKPYWFIENKINKTRTLFFITMTLPLAVIMLFWFTQTQLRWEEASLIPPLEETPAIEEAPELPPVTSTTTADLKQHHMITIEPGMHLAGIFQSLNIPYKVVHQILALGAITKPLQRLQPGKKLHIVTIEGQFSELDYIFSTQETLSIRYAEQGYQATIIANPLEKRALYVQGQIEGSFIQSGQKQGLSDSMLLDIARIFRWEINFNKDIQTGDQFKILYENQYLNGDCIEQGKILAVEFITRHKTYQAFYYTDPSGLSDFYHADGTSLQKPFLKAPLQARISSPFNRKRKHPILNIVRPHNGIDYAAPYGTPIRAIGDGTVTFVGRKGGYGRTIMIDHGQHYLSLYAHLSRYAKDLSSKKRIKRNEIIGYVGSSGQSTSAHLHFEIRVNNRPVNPATVKLPSHKSITSQYKSNFDAHVQRLIAELNHVPESSNTSI